MLNLKRLIIILFIISGLFLSCLMEENINLPYKGYQPEQLNDGWEISTPEAEGFEQEEINELFKNIYSEDLYPNLHSLLIVRNGKLVAEAYTKDKRERDMFHNIVSATKSISSMLTGIAIDKGLIESVNVPVYQIIPEYFDSDLRKRDITLHHVLTMETGLEFDNDDHTNEMFNYSGSSLEYVLHKNLIFLPGTDWYYGDGNPQLISGIIQKVSGQTEAQFAVENLFRPLGITTYQWEKHHDGLNYGAKGLWLLPRDMAKIGKLMAQDGLWNDEQILSSVWINESTKRQSFHQNYGYYWYPVEEPEAYYAEGHGGQLIWILPGEQLVVVITSDSYAKSYLLSSNYNNIFQAIRDAIID